jgi:hypothetical protein
MKILLDTSTKRAAAAGLPNDLVIGQLITPLTGFKRWAEVFAIDNGAFTRFDAQAFRNLLIRETPASQQCLFVCCPDVVGNARRTLEIYERKYKYIPVSWQSALVAQDGLEDLEVPWHDLDCLFIGGRDPWKDSQCAQDLVKAAVVLGKHVHIGRVNTPERYELFANLGAHTCDGSGIARYPAVKLPSMQEAHDKFAASSTKTEEGEDDHE